MIMRVMMLMLMVMLMLVMLVMVLLGTWCNMFNKIVTNLDVSAYADDYDLENVFNNKNKLNAERTASESLMQSMLPGAP